MSKPRLTLFVRNLPYSTTDEELAAIFSRYGTLKRCFTVKEKTVSDRCRGFGYVTFQEKESADSAVKHVRTVGSRPVQVTYAERKPSTKREENSKSHKRLTTKDEDESSCSDYEERTDRDSVQLKTKAQRTSPEYAIGRMVVLTGLPESATTKSIRVRCRKLGPVEAIEYPAPGRDTPTALVTYQLHKDARIAINQLTGKKFGGCTLCAVLLSKETKNRSTKSLKKCRIVVRNLSFKSSEDDVRAIFAAYGEVLDVTLPRKPNGHMLGYAFIQFGSFFEAKKAIDAVNGTEVKGRVIAADWLVQRDKYKKELEEDKEKDKEIGKEDKDSESEYGEETSEEESNDQDEEEEEEEDEEEEGDKKEEDDTNSDSEMKSIDSDEPTEKSRVKEDVTEGKTLFVRNVAADADDDQLEAIFKQFGHVQYCRTVINPDTGVCKGSAFVKFSDVSGVQSCMLAEGDPNTKGLWYDGRRLNISLALSKKELNLMKQKMDDRNEKEANKDKRNLYLAQEGVIIPGTDLAKELSKSDMAKRTRSHQERKRKLKNPYFFVSRTRLSVRNLPVSVNESQLKKLFTEHAGKGTIFKQVKIMRSKERFTAEGLGRSLGYGFVELADHDTALTALRAINNNPAISGPEQRPIVEFALEDTRALKLREERKTRLIATHGQHTSDGEAKVDQSAKHENKRVEWQLKWKERRLKRKTSDKQSRPVQTKTVALDNKSSKLKTTGLLRHNKASTKHRQVQSAGVKRRRTDDPHIHRSTKKKFSQKVVRSHREERAFDDLVTKYKNKLMANSVSDSRWYE